MRFLTRADGLPRTYAARAAQPDDQWNDALTKLFPAEVFSAYLAAVAILTAVTESPIYGVVAWLVYAAGLLATPIYMLATWDPDPGVRRDELRYAWPQLILALFAFTAWAFSLGGAFGLFPWYEQWVGGLALIVGALILTGLNKLIGTLSVQR